MVEEADPQVGPGLAQQRRHELQLVVVHPDRRAPGGVLGRCLGEAGVDLLVRAPPLPVEDRRGDHVVVERPQRGVGEAGVVVGDLLLGETHGHQVHAVGLEGVLRRAGGARPAHPGTVTGSHDGLERRDQTARAGLPPDRAVGPLHPVDGEAVGDDDEVIHVPPTLRGDAEPPGPRCPHADRPRCQWDVLAGRARVAQHGDLRAAARLGVGGAAGGPVGLAHRPAQLGAVERVDRPVAAGVRPAGRRRVPAGGCGRRGVRAASGWWPRRSRRAAG